MEKAERAAWGPEIRNRRLALDMSQDDLAAAAGVTRKTVNSVENGRSVPQAKVLEKLLDALDLTDTPVDARTKDVRGLLRTFEPLLLGLSDEGRARMAEEVIILLVNEIRAEATGGERPQALPSAAPSPGRAVHEYFDRVFDELGMMSDREARLDFSRAAWSSLLSISRDDAALEEGAAELLRMATLLREADRAGRTIVPDLFTWADSIQSDSIDRAVDAWHMVRHLQFSRNDWERAAADGMASAEDVAYDSKSKRWDEREMPPVPEDYDLAAHDPGVPSQYEREVAAQDEGYEINQDRHAR